MKVKKIYPRNSRKFKVKALNLNPKDDQDQDLLHLYDQDQDLQRQEEEVVEKSHQKEGVKDHEPEVRLQEDENTPVTKVDTITLQIQKTQVWDDQLTVIPNMTQI